MKKNTQLIELPDNRCLSYAEYGNTAGKPVLAFHGLPGSRFEHVPDISWLNSNNIRYLVLDRPGYGDSTLVKQRSFLDWTNDISQFADRLELNLFHVLGFSGGGPYAAACAYALPDCVIKTSLVSSQSSFTESGLAEKLNPQSKALFDLSIQSTELLVQQLSTIVNSGETMMAVMEALLSDPDKTIFENPQFRNMYLLSMDEAVKQGLEGIAYDMRVAASDWEFSPREITGAIDVWQGGLDNNVPPEMGRYLSENIPNAKIHFIKNQGHYLLFSMWEEILNSLFDT